MSMSSSAPSPSPPADAPSREQPLEAENERLRARVTALEAELVEVQTRTNRAIAKWQEQAYWLDRWHLDLDALMRRPGAMQLLGAMRAVRGVWWRAKVAKRKLLGPS